MDSRPIWMLLMLSVVAVYCEDQEATDDFNKLTVDCGLDSKENISLVYKGQAQTMYARTNEFGCKADKPTDEREIIFKLVVPYEDREKCGVEQVGEQAFKIGIRIQVHEILVTGDDLVYDVTCNYANVTHSTMNAGKVELFRGGQKLSNGSQSSADDPPLKDIELFLEDEFTNKISHASFDSPVRLQIRKTPYYEVCPEYVHTPSTCDDDMLKVTTSLECGVLTEGPFAECNGVLSPDSFVKECEDFLDTLVNELDECVEFRKREYLCFLQEMYECKCQKAGVAVHWLPSNECPSKRSPIFVETCTIINQHASITILHKGCGDSTILPTSWQFTSSSSLSTRTPVFQFDQFPIDTFMVNCTVQMCASTINCEQNCSNLPKMASIDYLETRVLSTGPLYLAESKPTLYTTDSSRNEGYPEGNLAAVLDPSIHGDCDGMFTASNFPLFIAVIVLGLLTLVLVILVACFVYRMHERTPSRQPVRADRMRTFRSHNLSHDLFSDTLKSSSAPTLGAFCRPTTPTDHHHSRSPLFNQTSPQSPQNSVDRAENEIAVQIFPQLSPRGSNTGACRIPPPPVLRAPHQPRQLGASRLLDSLYSDSKSALL